mgnify:CR=1 FL=1
MEQKRVFLIHGWEATSKMHWFPWLKQKLTELGFKAVVPDMPNTENPTLKEWSAYLKELIAEPDENTFLIGHSLGGSTILRYLSSLGVKRRVGGAVIVASSVETSKWPEIKSFFAKSLDYEKIKKICPKIIGIYSPSDPYVPFSNSEILKKKLNAEIIVAENAGHFNTEDGYIRLAQALNALLKIARN